jgi:hypothetical protein
MRTVAIAAIAVASLFVAANAQAKPPFNIHWPTSKYPCSTMPQFCAGYHGSN